MEFDKRYRVAIVRMGREKGIGIEEYEPKNGYQVNYIASLYVADESNKQTFLHVCEHITSLMDDDESALVRIYDKNRFATRKPWFSIFPELKIAPYDRHGNGAFRDVIKLAIDALNRKTDITETL